MMVMMVATLGIIPSSQSAVRKVMYQYKADKISHCLSG